MESGRMARGSRAARKRGPVACTADRPGEEGAAANEPRRRGRNQNEKRAERRKVRGAGRM